MSCAPSSIQWYTDQSDGTSGFGGTSGSLFFFIIYFCPPLVLPTSTGHSFRAIAMKLCRHITLGGIQSPSKNFGGQTPLGEIFSPNFFARYRSENLPESCPRPRKK